MTVDALDPLAVSRAIAAPARLREFNAAGVLHAADVHVAVRLAHRVEEARPEVLLAIALAVRGPRLGHVLTDLATIHSTATGDKDTPDDLDLGALAWPDPDTWPALVASSPLVAVGEDDPGPAPLRLVDSRLYLDRYWREERAVAADLVSRRDALAPGVGDDVLAAGLGRLFPVAGSTAAPGTATATAGAGAAPPDAAQRRAAEAAVRRHLAVIAGGPGTGKTTTVAKVAALLIEQALAAGRPLPQLVLAAPTGKAAARMQEVVHQAAEQLPVDAPVRAALLDLRALTLHRLLGWRPGARGRFRHDRANRLPHDGVIVDETSMVPLSLMARLLEAVRDDARLVLVGDPGQLSSVEAGAVLGDVVGPGGPEGEAAGIVVLDTGWRFGGAIARLAAAIRAGDATDAVAALREGAGITWIEADAAEAEAPALGPVREAVIAAAAGVIGAARGGDAEGALAGLDAFRLLCAHRTGPHGVDGWLRRIEAWLAVAVPGFTPDGGFYAGRPLLVTENDYGLRLFNGDTGVVVGAPGERVAAAFRRADGVVRLSPTRLATVETVYAMTIHKSQGSQFRTAAVVLPDEHSRILSRELLYTAVTRAQDRLVLVGTEAVVRAAVERPVARASGLRRRLWA